MPAKTFGHIKRGRPVSLVTGALVTMCIPSALCQASPAPASTNAQVASAPSQQRLAYEVATIKPPALNEYAMPLRVYIQAAFGIPVNSTGWVIGPDWINSAGYVIKAKAPDSVREAMQTMTSTERNQEVKLMQQSLLADRFKLKAHFEAREMPVYQLTVARGGSKLRENPDVSRGQTAVGRSMVRGTAVPVHALCSMLESVPDIGGRVVVDKTGLPGTYDVALKWAALDAALPASSPSGTAPPADTENTTLFTAIEEQLGLKLVPSKGPGQVLVIDHIERPSEN